MASHPLITTLKNLKSNARGIIITEPLWGVAFHLFIPYMSLYMLSLGLTYSQIGMITSIGMAFEIITGLISGAITDKFGRKKTTFINDILSWSIPCLIWAAAQSFVYFVVAAIISSLWRISMNSWTCLLVEDTDEDLLVDVYSWIYIAGLMTAFFAPIAGLLINYFSLVPTMRGLLIFAFLMMTAKFFIMNRMVTETKQGMIRMEAAKNQGLLSLLGEYKGVLKQILRSPPTLYLTGIMLVISICVIINSTFWAIIVTEKLNIPAEHIAFYTFARSIIMLLFFFLVMPRIRAMHFKRPMLAGFACIALSQLLLVTIPEKSYLLLLLSTFFEACSMATLNTLRDKMLVVTVDAKERARIMAIIFVIVICFTSPFGWIAGSLSEINRSLPFILNIVLFAIGGLLTYLASNNSK